MDCGLWTVGAQTPVLFSTYNFTGQVLNNPITVTPLDSLISDSQNLYAGPPVTLQPVAGIAATNLMPGDYRVVIQGVGQAWTITVPATTNLQNAAAIPKLGVLSQNVFFWTNALAGVSLTLNFTNAQDQFAGTWIGLNGSLAVSTNGGWRQFPAYAPFPSPFFFTRSIGLGDWGPSSLNDLAGDTILMAGTNNVVVIRDSAGNDLAYFSSTNGGTPKLSMAAYGSLSASSLPVPLQSLATNNASSLTNVATLSIPNELWVNTTNGSDANSGTNWSCAKATLLGAYDALSPNGGTIHFADGSWVGSNSGQGIWLMGNNDPNWGQPGYPGNSTPIGANGWRARKGMTRWIGHGGTQSSQWGFPAIANLLAGGGGPWLTNMNMPALWFSDCSLGIAFENTLVSSCPHPLRIGPDSTMAGATLCSQYWFLNCTFDCNAGATDDLVSGPAVWMESGQQTHFQNCNFGAYTTADGSLVITNNRHATVLCNIIPNYFYSAGGFKIVDSSFFFGGIRYFVPEGGDGGFQLDNDILDCGNNGVCPPLAWIIGETYYLTPMTIRNCVMWDGSFYPGLTLVQIDSPNGWQNSPADGVVTDTHLVNGPATIINNNVGFTGIPLDQPSAQRQVGIAGGKFWGMTDALRRNFAPATVVVTNQVSVGLPASCTNAPDPAGAANAFASTVVGQGAQNIRLATVPYTGLGAGDFYVFGAWVKLSGTNQVNTDAGALLLLSLDAAMAFDTTANYVQLNLPFMHNDWQWISGFSQVLNPGSRSSDMIFNARYYTNRQATIYSPVLMYVPAGTMGTNSVAELANHLSSAPPSASQGSLALIPGQRIALWDTNAGAWYYLGVTNGTLTVLAPAAKSASLTNLTITTPLDATRSVRLNGYAGDTSDDPVNGLDFILDHNLSGDRRLVIDDSATGYGLRLLTGGATMLLDGFQENVGETPLELQPGGSPLIVGGSIATTAMTITTPLDATRSVLLNGYASDTSGDAVNGINFLLDHNLSGDRRLLIDDSATGYGLRLLTGGATTLLDGFQENVGEAPLELQPGGSPLIVGGSLTSTGMTNKDPALAGASVLGMDANGKMIVGSSSGGATITVQTNEVQLNASAATLDIAGGSGIQVTGTVSGSIAHIGIAATGGGSGSLAVQTNGTQLSAAATTLNVQGGSNVLVNGSSSGGAATISVTVTGTVPVAVTAQNVTGGSGPGVVIVPNGAGNPGILLGGTNAGIWASNVVAASETTTNQSTNTGGFYFGSSQQSDIDASGVFHGNVTGNLTGTASGNDPSGTATAATNALAGPQLAAQLGSTPVARATADANGNTITTSYDASGAGTVAALNATQGLSGTIITAKIGAGVYDASGAALNATQGLGGVQLAAQLGSTPVGRATGDKNGNDITTSYDAINSAKNITNSPPALASGMGSGGGTANFFRADGNWAIPPGTGGSGSQTPLTGDVDAAKYGLTNASSVSTKLLVANSGAALLYSTTNNYLAYGDSITSGGVEAGIYAYPYWLTNLFVFTNLAAVNNAASSSHLNDVSNYFYGGYDSGNKCYTNWMPAIPGTNASISFWIGINDVMFDAINTTTWMAGLSNMWWTAHTNHFAPVVAFTIADSQLLSSAQEIVRSNLNYLIRSSCRSNAWLVCIDNDLVLPSTNTTYYLYDATANYGLHPNNYGEQRCALALGSVLYDWSVETHALYVDGPIQSSYGFAGNGSNLFGLAASAILGVLATTNIPTNTVLSAGTGISLSTNSANGVQNYTVSATGGSGSPMGGQMNFFAGVSGASTTLSYWGCYAAAVSAGLQLVGPEVGGGYFNGINIYTSSSPNNAAYIYDNGYKNIRATHTITMTWQVALTNVSNLRAWMGTTDTVSTQTGEDSGRPGYGFLLDTGTYGGNWQLVNCNNSGTAAAVDTGTAADTNPHAFQIQASSSGTTVYIDGTQVAVNAANMPTGLLSWFASVCTLDTTPKGLVFYQFYGAQNW